MRVSFAWIILSAVLAIDHAMGFNCPAHKKLKKYNFDKVVHAKAEKETPPSKTTQEWYVNVCDSEGGMPPECHSDDFMCGLLWSTLPDKEPVLTKAVHIKQDKVKKINTGPTQVSIFFKDVEYAGDVFQPYVSFDCDRDAEENYLLRPLWNGRFDYVNIKGPTGCLKKEYDNGRENAPNSGGRHSGLSWFTWFLIYVVLSTVLYFVVVSYLNTRGGSIQDFRDDLVDRVKTFATSLTLFLKEILSRVFNRTTSEGSGYSAV